MITIEEANSMIGKEVKGMGCCGIKDGVEVTGVLEKIENGDAYVSVSRGDDRASFPCLVNKNTLELV